MPCAPALDAVRAAARRGIRWIAWPTVSRRPPPPTSCSTRTTPSTGRSGRRRPSPRPSGATCRSCSPSGTPPATGATSWRTSPSRTTQVAAGRQPRLRGHQGRPRGAPGHRRRLHGGDDRADRPRRLADDLLPDARRRARSTAAPTSHADHFLQLLAGDPRDVGGPAGAGAADGRLDRGPRSRRSAGPCPRRPSARRSCRRGAAAGSASSTTARGGFGGAPKFPPSMVLEFLLRHHGRTGSRDALVMAERTCEAMARGGMYDQLGGGFARYCRGRGLGGAALREDALRQRPAAAGLRAPAPRERLGAGTPGRPGDRRVPAARPRHRGGRFRLGARRRHRRRRRGADLRLDTGPAQRGARTGRRRRVPRSCSASPTEGPSSTAPPRSSCAATPTTRSGGRRCERGCSRPGPQGPSRRATTRSSPPGTAWPSPRLGEAGTLLGVPDAGRGRARPARTSCCDDTSSTDGCGRIARRGGGQRRRRPRRLRQPRRGTPRPAPGHRRASLAGDRRGAARRRPVPVRGAGRRLPRHGRRRRAPLHPSAVPGRQRRALGRRRRSPGRCSRMPP